MTTSFTCACGTYFLKEVGFPILLPNCTILVCGPDCALRAKWEALATPREMFKNTTNMEFRVFRTGKVLLEFLEKNYTLTAPELLELIDFALECRDDVEWNYEVDMAGYCVELLNTSITGERTYQLGGTQTVQVDKVLRLKDVPPVMRAYWPYWRELLNDLIKEQRDELKTEMKMREAFGAQINSIQYEEEVFGGVLAIPHVIWPLMNG